MAAKKVAMLELQQVGWRADLKAVMLVEEKVE